uniref:Uncharacterized protein n=1 Tax=Mus spicilegus TaxID=10103 RepID=A0A8C6G4F2_MUSSI
MGGLKSQPNPSLPCVHSLPHAELPPPHPRSGGCQLERKGSLVAPNAALKLVLYLLNKHCCSCLSCSLGLWG